MEMELDGYYGRSNVLVSSLVSKFSPFFDVRAFGAAGDGVNDDSNAVSDAVQAAYSAGGGTIFFPIGTYLINSQLSIPNSGGSAPTQPSIRLTGAGASMASSAEAGGSGTVFGSSVLDLRNNAATAKIDTRGAGHLEIDHLTLMDGGSDSATFVFTTNTVLHIHDCAFYGTAAASAGVSANNDAILLGGTSTTIDGTATSPFQGYGTVIRDNFFDKIKRAVFGQTFCNGAQIVNNTVWNKSGYAAGGAIEFQGVALGYCTGNYIAGNLIEVVFYKYGIRFVDYSENNAVIANNIFDPVGNTTAAIRFETTNTIVNLVVLGWNGNSLTSVSDAASSLNTANTVISAQQQVPSVWPQPQTWVNLGAADWQIFKNPATGNSPVIAPTWSDGDNNEFDLLVRPSAAQPIMIFRYTPSGGGAEQHIQFRRTGPTTSAIDFIDGGIATITGASDIKIEAASGGAVWLGDTSATPVFVSGGNMFFQSGGVVLEAAAPTVAANRVGLGNGTATSATAGANGAVPAQVAGYLIVNIGGTNFKLPYFNI